SRSRRLNTCTASSISCSGAFRRRVTSKLRRRNIAAISVASLTAIWSGPTAYAPLPMTRAVRRDIEFLVSVSTVLMGVTEGGCALEGILEAVEGAGLDGGSDGAATTGDGVAGGVATVGAGREDGCACTEADCACST